MVLVKIYCDRGLDNNLYGIPRSSYMYMLGGPKGAQLSLSLDSQCIVECTCYSFGMFGVISWRMVGVNDGLYHHIAAYLPCNEIFSSNLIMTSALIYVTT